MKILVADDDEPLVRTLQRSLVHEQHEVVTARDGVAALAMLNRGDVDACILELVLPALDGLTLLERARTSGVSTPVLVLTVKSELRDRIAGLRGGADDYMTKPFAFEELLARLEAISRRRRAPRTRVGDLSLDLVARKARRGSAVLHLTDTQFALLAYLVERADEVVTRDDVLSNVFCHDEARHRSNLVAVHVSNLRAKLSVRNGPRIITVRGIGYRLETEPARSARRE